MTAMRWATSACSVRGEPGQQQRRLVGGHVREHQRDHLRVLVDDERAQLARVGAVQELERASATAAALSRSMISAARSAPRRLLEQLLGESRPPWAMCGRAVIMSRNSREHRLGLRAADRLEPGDLGGDRLDLGLAHVAEHRSRRARGPAGPARWRPCGRRARSSVERHVSAPPASRAAARRRPRAAARRGRRSRRATSASTSARRPRAPASRRSAALERGLRSAGRAASRRSCSTTYVVASSRALARRLRLEPGEEHQQRDHADQPAVADQRHRRGLRVGLLGRLRAPRRRPPPPCGRTASR